MRPGIDLLQRGHLRAGEARVGIRARALQHGGIEVTVARIGNDSVQQGLQMSSHPSNRPGIEQVHVVPQGRGQRLAQLEHCENQIERGAPLLQSEGFQLEIVAVEPRSPKRRGVLRG